MKNITRLITRYLLLASIIFAPIHLTSCAGLAEGIGGIGTQSSVGSVGFDSSEKKILGQARGVGAVIGAGAGYLIGNELGIGGEAGLALGAIIGGGIGDQVGKSQANKAKSKRLSNSDLRSMITAAKENNKRLAAYNTKVKKRIAELKVMKASEKKKYAAAESYSVDRSLKETDALIKERETAMNSLAGSQKAELASQIKIAKVHRATLAGHKATLASYKSVAN